MSSELTIGEADNPVSAPTGPFIEVARILAGITGFFAGRARVAAPEALAVPEPPAGGLDAGALAAGGIDAIRAEMGGGEPGGAKVVPLADWRSETVAEAPRAPDQEKPRATLWSGGTVPRAGRTLGETTRLLREAAAPFWAGVVGEASSTRLPEIPEGARFEALSFACDEGARDYRLYVPASLQGRPRGLVLMLHGCKQSPEDFALGTGMNDQAEREGLILVYPRQTACRNASRCWNWFRDADQHRGHGEPAILAAMASAVAEEFDVPRGRIFVAGLSAGGGMAAILSESYPDVFAAAGIHSGVPTGAAHDVASAFQAMRGEAATSGARGAGGRRIVFQGIEDVVVHPVNAARLLPEGIEAAPRRVGRTKGGRVFQRLALGRSEAAAPEGELWLVEAAGHAWSGGRGDGSYTDPDGPDASAEMVRFFLGQAWTPARHC